MATVVGWIRQHPAVWALLGAVVLGQVLQRILQSYVNQSLTGAIVVLMVTLALAAVIVWLRVSLGNQLAAAARARPLALPRPVSLPARYAVADAPDKVITALLGVVDLALLLLVQTTVRAPALAVAEAYVPRAWAETAFVTVVVLLALLMLMKLYGAGAPVLVLLVWWGLDRVVPTAGFLGARPALVTSRATAPVPAMPQPAADPASARSAPQREAVVEPTVPSAAKAELEPTVPAAKPHPERPTHAEATLVATGESESDRTAVTASPPEAKQVAAERNPSPADSEATMPAIDHAEPEPEPTLLAAEPAAAPPAEPKVAPAEQKAKLPGADEPTIISYRRPPKPDSGGSS